MKTMEDDEQEPITIVDVCCGKGVFSMLASYIFQDDVRIRNIIMLDKATIKWNHVDIVNTSAEKDKRPMIEPWAQCNLHEIDQVVDRLESIPNPVALVGIHLCKTLSPTCAGIVNAMDPSHCPFFVLAPCCLPRVVTQSDRKIGDRAVIEVRQYESQSEREIRRVAKDNRDAAMMRKPSLRPTFRSDQVDIIGKEAQTEWFPCWKCGEVGHLKADCPSTQTTGRPQLVKPPLLKIDVSKVLESDRPFDIYCELLQTSLQRDSVEVVETGLVNNKVEHQRENWNNGRKSIYIVATTLL